MGAALGAIGAGTAGTAGSSALASTGMSLLGSLLGGSGKESSMGDLGKSMLSKTLAPQDGSKGSDFSNALLSKLMPQQSQPQDNSLNDMMNVNQNSLNNLGTQTNDLFKKKYIGQ